MIKILRYLLAPAFGLLFLKTLISSYQEDFLFDFVIFSVIGTLFLIPFIATIREDYKDFLQTKKIGGFFSTFIGSIMIVFASGFYLTKENAINSPTLLRAFYDGDYNGVSIDLKSNGDYIIANGSGLGQNYFYGTYVLADSIIVLDKKRIDNVIKSDHLVIRSIEQDYEEASGKFIDYIYQIDGEGGNLNSELRFRIVTDSRKK